MTVARPTALTDPTPDPLKLSLAAPAGRLYAPLCLVGQPDGRLAVQRPEDAHRRRKWVDRVRQNIDWRARLDREHSLTDRVWRSRCGDERAQQSTLAAIDNDGHVAACFRHLTGRRMGVIDRFLERVMALLERLLELQPNTRRGWVGVGCVGDGRVVGL